MKTFHLFLGYDYYPGGFLDYKGSFETLQQAKAHPRGSTDWIEILQTQADGSLSIAFRGNNK